MFLKVKFGGFFVNSPCVEQVSVNVTFPRGQRGGYSNWRCGFYSFLVKEIIMMAEMRILALKVAAIKIFELQT